MYKLIKALQMMGRLEIERKLIELRLQKHTVCMTRIYNVNENICMYILATQHKHNYIIIT